MGSLLSIGNVGVFTKNNGNGSGDFRDNTFVSNSGNGGRRSKGEQEREHRGGRSGGKKHHRHNCDND